MSNTNPKFRLLHPAAPATAQRTYIVIGLGRSGTSFVASVLAYLDIFMGDAATEGTLEDARLAKPIEARNTDATAAVIADYNSRHDVWGYKRPSMLLYANWTEAMFRNPHYIFTHRDFFAIALRNEIAISRDITESLRKCAEASKHIYTLLETSTAPALHLSFEVMNAERLRAAEIIRDFARPEDAGKPIDGASFEAFMDARLKSYLG